VSNRKSKDWAPTPPKGVAATVAAKSRKRRQAQRALTEIDAHAPVRRRNDLAPRLKFVMTPTDRLKPASRQVRRRDATQKARVRASIERFGVCRPILVSADHTIVEGHGVWEVAKELGIAEIPCIVVDHLDANELRLLPIALNRISETGDWDPEILRIEFEELIVLGEDLVLTGFETVEIDTLLLGDTDDVSDEEALPELRADAVSRAGDVWVLGDHRLIQGDARDPYAYVLIMSEGELARLVLTDEPFNVPNVGHVTGDGRHREFAMANGEMNAEEFMAFNKAWMSAAMAYLVDGGLLATFIDWRSVEIVLACGRELDLALLNVIVWAKSNGGQGSLWRSQHELLPFFKKGSAPHVNNIELGRHGRWRSNVWTYPGASSLGSDAREGLAQHPTVKPRALLEDALLDVTNRGDIVLEPFAGSGSTLLAAEATGRLCRAIEIDGHYCDLTIRRWEQTTGCVARLAETGETFGEVQARRSDDRDAETPGSQSWARDGDADVEGVQP
jgi:DNA modification methylase